MVCSFAPVRRADNGRSNVRAEREGMRTMKDKLTFYGTLAVVLLSFAFAAWHTVSYGAP